MKDEMDSIRRQLDSVTAKLAAQAIALKFLARDLTGEQLLDLASFAAWEHAQLRQTSLTDQQFYRVQAGLQQVFESLLVKTPKTHQECDVIDTKGFPYPW